MNNTNALFALLCEPLAELEPSIYCNVFRAKEDKYIADFNIAGAKKEDIKIESDGQNLNVVYKYGGSDYYFNAELPDDANSDNIAAEYKNGILTLTADKVNKRKEISVL